MFKKNQSPDIVSTYNCTHVFYKLGWGGPTSYISLWIIFDVLWSNPCFFPGVSQRSRRGRCDFPRGDPGVVPEVKTKKAQTDDNQSWLRCMTPGSVWDQSFGLLPYGNWIFLPQLLEDQMNGWHLPEVPQISKPIDIHMTSGRHPDIKSLLCEFIDKKQLVGGVVAFPADTGRRQTMSTMDICQTSVRCPQIGIHIYPAGGPGQARFTEQTSAEYLADVVGYV